MQSNLYVDVGSLFGMQTHTVFTGTNLKVACPSTYEEMMRLLPYATLVGFGGGADIHPSLYGCRDVASAVGHAPSNRDLVEQEAFGYCYNNGIPAFGICRGAQFLCAMSGGRLVQDVRNHGGDHTIYTEDNQLMPMTSTHHQMMYPWETKHHLLAWTDKLSPQYVHSIPNYVQHDVDPEVVFFEDTGALAVQGHPEWMDPRSRTVQQVRKWVQKYLNINL